MKNNKEKNIEKNLRKDDKMKKNNKKKLLVFLGISVFTVLGGTLAYFTTSTTFRNIFNTAKYETKIVESFVSPDNWTPGSCCLLLKERLKILAIINSDRMTEEYDLVCVQKIIH